MSQKLQQAIAATRAGQKKEAQLLLTETLKADPDNVQAWYLLSLLVDDPGKQIAYLQKTVALDPSHTKAQTRLQRLTETAVAVAPTPPDPVTEMEAEPAAEAEPTADVPPPITTTLELEKEAAADETAAAETAAADTAAAAAEEPADDAPVLADIPSWLQDPFAEADPAVPEQEQETIVSERTQTMAVPATSAADAGASDAAAPETPTAQTAVPDAAPQSPSQPPEKTTPAAKDDDASLRRMNFILYTLLIGALLIFLLLMYTLLSS